MNRLTQSCILILVIFSLFAVLFFAAKYDKSVADALTAAGTVLAVIWAVFHQEIYNKMNRPLLDLRFRQEPPYFRSAPLLPEGLGYFMTIGIQNTGVRTAKNCQPFLTSVGKLGPNGWERQTNWLHVPLRWVLDENVFLKTGSPLEERDIVPNRPYFFNVGYISTTHADILRLYPIIEPTAQNLFLDKGEYSFEVTVSAEDAKPRKAMFYVNWKGGFYNESTNVDEVMSIAFKVITEDNFSKMKGKLRQFWPFRNVIK